MAWTRWAVTAADRRANAFLRFELNEDRQMAGMRARPVVDCLQAADEPQAATADVDIGGMEDLEARAAQVPFGIDGCRRVGRRCPGKDQRARLREAAPGGIVVEVEFEHPHAAVELNVERVVRIGESPCQPLGRPRCAFVVAARVHCREHRTVRFDVVGVVDADELKIIQANGIGVIAGGGGGDQQAGGQWRNQRAQGLNHD